MQDRGRPRTVELLLADDDEAAVPRYGLPLECLRSAPRPAPLDEPDALWDATGDPNDLRRQRWGLVAPSGPRGDRLLGLVEPLRRWRQEAQGGAPVAVYRVRPVMDSAYARGWKREVYRDERTPEKDRPRYLLLLGDLHELPLELQAELSTDAYVGRLAFAADADYEAYVAKVLRWEREPARESRARLLFYTSRDGTSATETGYRALITPSMAACRQRQEDADFPRADIHELGGTQESLLARASDVGAGVLFTLSHGRGRPPSGWAGPGERLAHQGELKLPDGRFLSADALASRPFVPGGVWFSFACFSAGTPSRSSYAHWLRKLPSTDPNARRGLEALPREGETPFIAAPARAALANPDGPLAVLGHVDLAWSHSFSDRGQGTPSRFIELLKELARGSRAGVALHTLTQVLNETSSELASLYNQEEQERAGGLPSSIDLLERARLWILRQDLANYLLLGDPAVRLPLASPREPARAVAPAPAPADFNRLASSVLRDQFRMPSLEAPAHGPEALEAVVLALLSGQQDAGVLADAHGVSVTELRRWEALYRAAGLAALARHLSGQG
ncbi:C25 family cysteine peptidase [Pyxidicoccus trucidator]|uniref:C25 family cysteine peptidase n=1 Tax=Pyxidicoccus trucidator TaxID=2709662 RepID=UPI0013DD5CB7|nr:C25 family cysteine peptidase [Pyxidicoccus trucidator]